MQPHGQRPPVTSRSGPILDSQHGSGSGGPGLVHRLSNSQLSFNTSSIASVFSQVPRLSTTGPLASATGQHRSSQVSSSSSTLSLLFGKQSFSSGLVISGLSAAEGGNTSDTQSSSSVNIALGPSCRSSRATQVRWCLWGVFTMIYKTFCCSRNKSLQEWTAISLQMGLCPFSADANCPFQGFYGQRQVKHFTSKWFIT